MTVTVIRVMLAALFLVAPMTWARRAATFDAEHGGHRAFGLMLGSYALGLMLFFWR